MLAILGSTIGANPAGAGQWHAVGARVAVPVVRLAATGATRGGVSLASWADDAPRAHIDGQSVVVRRSTVTNQDADFDPFEKDDAAAATADVAMPAVEVALAPGAQRPFDDVFDPFDRDDAKRAVEPESEASKPAESTDAVEPQVEEPQAPSQPVEPPTSDEPAAAPSLDEELPAAAPIAPPRAQPEQIRDAVEPELDHELATPAPRRRGEAPARRQGAIDGEITGADLDQMLSEPQADIEAQLQFGGDSFQDLPPLTPEQEEERLQQIEKERRDSEKYCGEIFEAVKADTIGTISLDIRLKGNPGEDFPFECGLGDERFHGRSWPQITYLWKASGLCHKPLYFEQAQLERYGHDWGPVIQPIVSGAHFFGTLPILPYKMGIETPNECIYTLGYYRPGSCAPYMIPAFPFTWRAAAFEAGAWTGGVFAIP